MRIVLVMIGKTDAKWLSDGISEYVARICHFNPFQTIVIPDMKNTRNMDSRTQKELEGDAILKQLLPGDDVILLDDKGLEHTSESMAEWLDRRMQLSSKRLVFIIGGPYGFSDKVYAAARCKLSLSRMTFSHQMVRLIFTEQLYRAFTIMKGIPYHHS
ncbi:MAG: 23S rRNA (pseudouridine(1915)-N(3))-methyltransferase RlmH [Bacteroidaceae bacterium]|nr:23S rRNA (pseudouridine(1915)-N(3))-methyltransferase RlmH [Bacteroidaceae bacterium]